MQGVPSLLFLWTQRFDTSQVSVVHTFPSSQWASVVHSTHRSFVSSHCGPAPEHGAQVWALQDPPAHVSAPLQ